MLQEANIATMTSKWGPRALGTAKGWLATVTLRAMVSYLQRGARNQRWLLSERELEPMRAELRDQELPSDAWLVSKWLGRAIVGSERDQETLEMLAYGARTAKTAEELAAEHGLTVASLKSRVFHFKHKYEPLLRKRRRAVLTMVALGGALAIGVAAALVWHGPNPATAAVTSAAAPIAESASAAGSAEPDTVSALPSTSAAPPGSWLGAPPPPASSPITPSESKPQRRLHKR
jgi:DNA-directed RNA polymerase specialized sigma24 family protein